MHQMDYYGGSDRNDPIPLLDSKWKLAMKIMTGFSLAIGTTAVVCALYIYFSVIRPVMTIASHLLFPSMILLLLGFGFPFLTFLGFRGTIKQHMKHLRKCFYGMCAFIFISVVVGLYTIITTYVGDTYIKKISFEKSIHIYHQDLGLAVQVNNIQIMLGCCGKNKPQDWNENEQFRCNISNPNVHRCSVPYSCCISNTNYPPPWNCGLHILNFTESENSTFWKSIIYEDGCQKKVEQFLASHAFYLIISFLLMTLCETFVWKFSLIIVTVYEENVRERRHLPLNRENISIINNEDL